MKNLPKVVHFEINVDDPKRAIKFYEKTFGWEFTKWEGPMNYWLIKTGEDSEQGINGGLMKRQEPEASVQNAIDVSSVDEYINKIEAYGGKIYAPKMPIPGVGWVAGFMDTEGNKFTIIQSDETVK